MFIFFPNTGHLHVRVKARNIVGALASISEILYENEININQMFNRPVAEGGYALTDFLIHYTDYSNPLNDQSLKNLITSKFFKSSVRPKFDFTVSFPLLKDYKNE